jgi:hypothetical protein
VYGFLKKVLSKKNLNRKRKKRIIEGRMDEVEIVLY